MISAPLQSKINRVISYMEGPAKEKNIAINAMLAEIECEVLRGQNEVRTEVIKSIEKIQESWR